ncbi:MAG: hypothetical protein RL274_1618 [Pseudomonadota bacterium]
MVTHPSPEVSLNLSLALARQLDARINVASKDTGTRVSIVHTYIPAIVGQTAHAVRAV